MCLVRKALTCLVAVGVAGLHGPVGVELLEGFGERPVTVTVLRR